MKIKTTVVLLIVATLFGGLAGVGFTRYRMNQQHQYSMMIHDKMYCYSNIRLINQIDSMKFENARKSLERNLALRVIWAERATMASDKTGHEAKELLKLVAKHRMDPKYIEEENRVRAWLAGDPNADVEAAPNP